MVSKHWAVRYTHGKMKIHFTYTLDDVWMESNLKKFSLCNNTKRAHLEQYWHCTGAYRSKIIINKPILKYKIFKFAPLRSNLQRPKFEIHFTKWSLYRSSTKQFQLFIKSRSKTMLLFLDFIWTLSIYKYRYLPNLHYTNRFLES